MRWLQFSRAFDIHTSLTLEQAATLIDKALAPEQSHFQWYKDALFRPVQFREVEYQGRVEYDGFRMQKVFIGRNSFLPIIRGKFVPDENGTSVIIQISLQRGVLPFFYFFAILLCIVWTGMIAGAIILRSSFLFLAGPVIMSGFLFWMYKSGESSFKEDADEATRWLEKLFAAKP